jgi:hypothetical protein
MITIKCQYTGIEFEAESKRTKNHPAVTAFLNDANEDGKRGVGAYAEAKRLLSEAVGNFGDIDSLMAAVSAAYADWKSGARGKSVMSYKERIARDGRIVAGIVASRNEDGYKWQIDADYMNR